MSDFIPPATRIGSADTDISTDETPSLIAASKVEGTWVFDRKGDKLGSIYDVMIDKRSGKVAYAVLSLGGFLGLGSDYFPIPWNTLTYDVQEGGYVVAFERDRFSGAPSYSAADEPGWMERGYARRIDDHYGTAIARGR
ncbi:PRC-barrel domain-containing protein [Tianweitania sp. BSSL-BM11]|uniref:PRC-barrel domain-containing protein n=1 Tax=Tianweitania aestuarii TaxID=2814886 RepID=A0ABS5RUV0_9HYPH|nr:PRC-barrel domain-containing protein [Tianweitania aestuarii]MBS9720843.1 PRC-barrel domain-containing protein [Tianweitania aestuarii]